MMKFNILKRKTNFDEVESLLEKYYDGFTTSDEERRLCSLLSDANLPARFVPDRAILKFFDSRKAPVRPVIRFNAMRWSAAAAVLVVAFIGIKSLYIPEAVNYAYIDGKKVTDVEQIRSQALASLAVVTNSPDEVKESVKNLNGSDLIQQQLDVFAELP